MDYRILEMTALPKVVKQARGLFGEETILDIWQEQIEENRAILRILLDTDQTEYVSDELTDQFEDTEGFRIMIYTIEATVPRPEIEKEESEEEAENEATADQKTQRISREELYTDIQEGSELNWFYIAMTLLSTIVAAVGLVRDDVALIIGAMVIAPLLGPNVSMALATTLGDQELAWRSLKTNAAGLFAALFVAILMGGLMPVDLASEQIVSKTNVNLGDIAVSLAAGGAGVLAFTRNVSSTIVGVMVAVALLPPLVNAGLLIGAGFYTLAMGSIILTTTNMICINLAGIFTFLVQDIRPRTWWEAEKAKKAARKAIALWIILLTILAVIIFIWN